MNCGRSYSPSRKNVKSRHFDDDGYAGDIWTWVAIDADTKLIPSFMIGQRDPVTARAFMEDLAGRLANRVQLTSGGLKAYLTAVKSAFRNDIDYAVSSRFTETQLKARSGTAQRIAWAAKRKRSGVGQTRSTSARVTWSVRI